MLDNRSERPPPPCDHRRAAGGGVGPRDGWQSDGRESEGSRHAEEQAPHGGAVDGMEPEAPRGGGKHGRGGAACGGMEATSGGGAHQGREVNGERWVVTIPRGLGGTRRVRRLGAAPRGRVSLPRGKPEEGRRKAEKAGEEQQ